MNKGELKSVVKKILTTGILSLKVPDYVMKNKGWVFKEEAHLIHTKVDGASTFVKLKSELSNDGGLKILLSLDVNAPLIIWKGKIRLYEKVMGVLKIRKTVNYKVYIRNSSLMLMYFIPKDGVVKELNGDLKIGKLEFKCKSGGLTKKIFQYFRKWCGYDDNYIKKEIKKGFEKGKKSILKMLEKKKGDFFSNLEETNAKLRTILI